MRETHSGEDIANLFEQLREVKKNISAIKTVIDGTHVFCSFGNVNKDGIFDRLTKLEQSICKHTNQEKKCKDCGKEL